MNDQVNMNDQVDIILIEDNPFEAELAFHSFEKNHLANRIVHLDDGAEALDFIFSRGNYESRIGFISIYKSSVSI